MAKYKIEIQTGESAGNIKFTSADGKTVLNELAQLLQAGAGGLKDMYVALKEENVAASGVLTGSTVVEDDTVIIGGITFTGKDSPSGELQFQTGGTDAAAMTSLAAKINAHSTLAAIVSAELTDTAEVTVTSKLPGTEGNFIELAATGGISAGAATLASGTLVSASSVTVSAGRVVS